jgi:hypothetical protein
MRANLPTTAVLGVLLAVVPTLTQAQDKKEPKSATDKERLQGVWKIALLEVDGKFEKDDVGKTLTFKGDKLLPQGLEGAFTLKLDPEKNRASSTSSTRRVECG